MRLCPFLQSPPALEFSSSDLVWSKVEGWRDKKDGVALIPFPRVDDFLRVARIIYNQDKHVDRKGVPCHGPQDKMAAETRAIFAPCISEDLLLRVQSLLYAGVSVETIMQRHNESVEKQGGPSNRDDLLTHRVAVATDDSLRQSQLHSFLIQDNKAILVAWIVAPKFGSSNAHKWMRALYNRVQTKDPVWKLVGFIVDDPLADVLTIRLVAQSSPKLDTDRNLCGNGVLAQPLKLRLLNEKKPRVYKRVDWLVDKLGTKVHSFFWLDEYSENDDFAQYWKDEWASGLTSWRKALKILNCNIVIEGTRAKVIDEFGICNCHWAEMGNLCEHLLKKQLSGLVNLESNDTTMNVASFANRDQELVNEDPINEEVLSPYANDCGNGDVAAERTKAMISVESQVVEATETLGVITENDRMEAENKNRSTINHPSSADDAASIDGPRDNLVNASDCSRDSKAVGNMMVVRYS
ncbi:unnamed protein product [Malus baccata var. baccata]